MTVVAEQRVVMDDVAAAIELQRVRGHLANAGSLKASKPDVVAAVSDMALAQAQDRQAGFARRRRMVHQARQGRGRGSASQEPVHRALLAVSQNGRPERTGSGSSLHGRTPDFRQNGPRRPATIAGPCRNQRFGNLFARITEFRTVATRYDKTAESIAAAVHVVTGVVAAT